MIKSLPSIPIQLELVKRNIKKHLYNTILPVKMLVKNSKCTDRT